MTSTSKAVHEFTADELEEILQEKRKVERDQKANARKQYESDRDDLINYLGNYAKNTVDMMAELKLAAFIELQKFRLRMMEYGDLRHKENNKGSFEIKNDHFKIIFTSQINKKFDERAVIAEEKLKEFLKTFVKKRDTGTYTLLQTVLERNPTTGDFDINLINRLYAIEDQFDNPLWVDALRLFKESYSPYGTAQYVRFFSKNLTNNMWEPLVLDFAKLKSNAPADTEPQPEATEA